MRKILIVEDERSARYVLRQILTPLGYQLFEADNAADARTLMEQQRPDLLLLDMRLSPAAHRLEGPELLQEFEGRYPTPVVIISGVEDLDEIKATMEHGAQDYLLKPVEPDVLIPLVRRILEPGDEAHASVPARGLELPPELDRMITRDHALLQLKSLLLQVAPLDSTVFIEGETGTGKELVASLLHDLGPRRDGPFVAVNCGAIPVNLLEGELFGAEPGAYTGARKMRKGKVEEAHLGTLFLDEVGEIPLEQQSALLRVIQEKAVVRLGGNTPIEVDFRLVTATHVDLEQAVRDGRFREDLFYRLHVVPITIPPLRERPGDVPLLIRHEYQRLTGAALPAGDGVLAPLAALPWRGNVRELINHVERSYILSNVHRRPFVDVLLEQARSGGGDAGMRGVAGPPTEAGADPVASSDPLDGLLERLLAAGDEPERDLLEAVELALVEQALRRAGGNKTRAAQLLGIRRKAMERRCRKLSG